MATARIMSSSQGAGASSDGTSVSAAVHSVLTRDDDNAGQMLPAAGRTVVAVIENRAMEVRASALSPHD